jgi:hypothetical protein
MKKFVARFASLVTGVLSGFDRLVFRGLLPMLHAQMGMFTFLTRTGVPLLDFKAYVETTTARVKAAALAEARHGRRPVRYLESSGTDKEALARTLHQEHPVEDGLICILTALEPCMTFEYHRSQDHSERGLRLRTSKCLHLYKYWLHPQFGFMSARLQTWFPFNIQVCMNGREWLARRLASEGLLDGVIRNDNCFPRVGDPERAQILMDEQLATEWPRVLDGIAAELNPLHATIFEAWPQRYYWTAYQTEWATDVLFKDPRSLAGIYPALVRHAMTHFQSPDVMRFLGRKAHGNFTGELITSFKDRAEGVRVKHWARGNSIKMYDKAGSVLRVETTIAQPAEFKVYRPSKEDSGDPTLRWLPMRKGVADLHRRAQVSQRANEAYLDALDAVNDDTPLATVLDRVSSHTTWNERRVRALRIGDPDDLALLRAVSRGEFALSGFRNRDLRTLLYPKTVDTTVANIRRLSARVSRLLRLLRAHGIIHKVPKSHRYRLTDAGRLLTAGLFAARASTIKQLLREAA